MADLPHTMNDLMLAAAKALNERDSERLEQLQAHADAWLQDAASMDARHTLLDAMMDAADELADYEEE